MVSFSQLNKNDGRQGRIRKKLQLEDVKGRLLALQCEAQNLQRIFDDFNAANILLFMGKMESSTPSHQLDADPALRSLVTAENIIDCIKDASRSVGESDHSVVNWETFGNSEDGDSESGDGDGDDIDHQLRDGCAIKWKQNIMITKDGTERKLSNEELDEYRCLVESDTS